MSRPDDPEELRLRILRALRSNGRESYSRIAATLGTTRQQVMRIVQDALNQDELRLTVSISPDLLGLERFAYLQIAVDGPVPPVRSAVSAMPETTFVADISGAFTLDAEIRVRADPHLSETVDAIRELSGVTTVRTHLYERIDINLYSPLRTGKSSLRVDDVDLAIIRQLRLDGRSSFRELGECSGISPSGARLRLERLIAREAIKVVGIPVRGSRSELPSLGAGIRARGQLARAVARVRTLDPEFLALTIGEFDLIATFSAESYDGLLVLMDRLRESEEVASLETWANLRIVKEQYGEDDRISPIPRTDRGADHGGSRRR